jgi:ribonuclease-3
LTHKSSAYERGSPGEGHADNEQLEFLGDAVLGFVVTDLLLRRFPLYREGQLTKLRAQLVSETHLHEVAQTLRLGDFLLLGRGEEMSGGRAKKALLADALEAILAAVYLDGGIQPVRTLIERHVIGDAAALDIAVPGLGDYKSALQTIAQSRRLPYPRYTIVQSNGPEHAKTFTVEAKVGSTWVSQAQGPSKKLASQRAARMILEQLQPDME